LLLTIFKSILAIVFGYS